MQTIAITSNRFYGELIDRQPVQNTYSTMHVLQTHRFDAESFIERTVTLSNLILSVIKELGETVVSHKRVPLPNNSLAEYGQLTNIRKLQKGVCVFFHRYKTSGILHLIAQTC